MNMSAAVKMGEWTNSPMSWLQAVGRGHFFWGGPVRGLGRPSHIGVGTDKGYLLLLPLPLPWPLLNGTSTYPMESGTPHLMDGRTDDDVKNDDNKNNDNDNDDDSGGDSGGSGGSVAVVMPVLQIVLLLLW